MPSIDTELIAPLSRISEILLKRPGRVSVDGIKRLANIYGFETFTDTLAVNDQNDLVFAYPESRSTTPVGKEVPQIERLSLSGKILLIDIDFQDGAVKNVGLSSAINIESIDARSYDFVDGFGSFPKVGTILYENLQSTTLDKFNKNLRLLGQLDRLSASAPFDLFNTFNLLTYNLLKACAAEKEHIADNSADILTEKELAADYDVGVRGVGKVLVNQSDKIGLFLKFWQDNRFLAELDRSERPEYMLHFKIMESPRADPVETKETKRVVEWFNGQWSPDVPLDLLVLELCPPVWIPEDLLLELGLNEYEVVTPDNSVFNSTTDTLDDFYQEINKNYSYTFGTEDQIIESFFLTGCKFVKIYKLKLAELDKLRALVSGLRSWCLVNNVVRNLLQGQQKTAGSSQTDELWLNDMVRGNLEKLDNSSGASSEVIRLSVETLEPQQIDLTIRGVLLKIIDGQVKSSDKKLAKLVTKTEELF
ncbi:hypothetical protein OGAPHI_004064 [Ogataea philodendri]|uniref:Mediator of RNA polymerase II transcription subunit 1 n=1 Tax=Ogataea philodendri TaxID=1378263 RepID=A0A9P8P6C9_9ASCO|nr:uncharacterized protein OGAPHI_004064 [Ogataea philodendri]KAH3665875.1 hypothetical protein OGAPHI_004064 [Ogataea philodendri]